jgi:RNA-binding protein YhbY
MNSNSMVSQSVNANVLAELARLQAENEVLKAKVIKKVRPITFKVSEKTQALSVYGLNNRFPVTLYKQQWERLFSVLPEMKSFIAENAGNLAVKEDV